MSTFEIEYEPGSTPLNPDELAGLIPTYITTQGELNKLERENILEAQLWASKRKKRDVLDIGFLLKLHKRMLKNVWKWAGKTRTSDKSIGIPWQQIHPDLGKLISDARYWIENETYPWDELGARFHHRLVLIHPFPNGNGRHARLMTDILLEANGQKPFTWGAVTSKSSIDTRGTLRDEYISSLQEADQRKYSRLTTFLRS